MFDSFSFGKTTVEETDGQYTLSKEEYMKPRGLTSVRELPKLMILGHPSLSFSRRVHSKQ